VVDQPQQVAQGVKKTANGKPDCRGMEPKNKKARQRTSGSQQSETRGNDFSRKVKTKKTRGSEAAKKRFDTGNKRDQETRPGKKKSGRAYHTFQLRTRGYWTKGAKKVLGKYGQNQGVDPPNRATTIRRTPGKQQQGKTQSAKGIGDN